MSTLMERLMAEKFGRSRPSLRASSRRSTPQTFEEKREQWRAEALAKLAEPKPTAPAQPVRVVASPPPPTPAPVPTSAPTTTARGSCKAINPVTGRQCALLAGHTKPHRHGSTEFHLAAVPGQRITRREELELYAAATHCSPFGG